MPELGRCVCDAGADQLHEHSDFEPFACGDCDCPEHRPVETADSITLRGAQTPTEPQTQPPLLTIPAEINFAELRVTQTAQWLDQLADGIHETHPTPADHPPAVCALADLLEQAMPEHIDPFEALALAIRRIRAGAATSRARSVIKRATNKLAKHHREERP